MAVMQSGAMEQVGTYQELYEQPANTFVAGFLGSPPMNFFTAYRRNDDLYLEVGDTPLRLPLSTRLLQRLTPHDTLTVGIRPEHFRLTEPRTPLALPCTVEMVEMSMSDTTQVLFVLHGTSTFSAKLAPQLPVRARDTVWLQLVPQHLFYFGRDGKSL
jgi:ABC-type sugar transport system ATPase subunit